MVKVALAQINPIVGDLKYNSARILQFIKKAKAERVDIVVFPEMSLSGYPPEDLVLDPSFMQALEEELEIICRETKNIVAIIGTLRKNTQSGEKSLYNSAAIFENGKIIGFQDKALLPTYDVFCERRYFEPAQEMRVWNMAHLKIGVTICEDIWQHAGAVGYSDYTKDPVEDLRTKNVDLVINLSSSPYCMGRVSTRLDVCRKAALTLGCPLFLCNQVGGNDSLIFDGHSCVFGADGKMRALAKGFQEDFLVVDTREVVTYKEDAISELIQALCLGVKDYFGKQGFKKAVLGLSGGIDSAVVAWIAKEALGEENVVAFAMPSRFSSHQAQIDAEKLAKALHIDLKMLSIEPAFESLLKTLRLSPEGGLAAENLQARIRGTLLMAFSNQWGHLVLNTSNKSEMALGYTTLYGDMCGALCVIGDVLKTQVYKMAAWINQNQEIIPSSILQKDPSAELRHNQKDEDTLPPYAVVDAVVKGYIEEGLQIEEIALNNHIDLKLVADLISKIHLNEYKRRQSPPLLRVSKKAFNVGRRVPIVQRWHVPRN